MAYNLKMAEKPEYITISMTNAILSSLKNVVMSGSKGFKGGELWRDLQLRSYISGFCILSGTSFANFCVMIGDYKQNGGEYLFEDGELKWCHRMKTTSDHAEIKELKEVLGL